MRNLAIIPARSGSKGLKDKNIKLLSGIPLLAYSIRAAENSQMFNKIMVSTDSEIYADVAKKYGAEVPFMRSAVLSGDAAGSWDVVLDVLSKYQEQDEIFDTVCLLQPTSPLRSPQDIVNGYGVLADKEADAVTAVCKMDHSPLWSMVLPEDGSLKDFIRKSVPRQMMEQHYRINGALYIRKLDYSEVGIIILNREEYAYIMDRNRSIDIDTIEDFKYVEFLLGGLSENQDD